MRLSNLPGAEAGYNGATRRRERRNAYGPHLDHRWSGVHRLHLVEYLLRQDHEILCLDNYFTGSKANLLHLRDHPRLEMIRHDVVNPINLEVDQVYHLACPASPVHYQYNPVKTIKTNVLGTLNMLDWPSGSRPESSWPPRPRSMATPGSSPAGGVLGERQPHRDSQLL